MADDGGRPEHVQGSRDDSGLISGRFRLGELLGSGGSASVFAAVDIESGETIALKLLHPHLSQSDAARSAFFAEARASDVLRHPNIAGVRGVGVHVSGDEPLAWIALEHAGGASLAEVVDRSGPLTVAEALAVADGVLAALEYAHGAGLVHRDVSPANIMVSRDPHGTLRPSGIRLVDFGLADAAGRTAVGTDVLRTPQEAGQGLPGGIPADSEGEPSLEPSAPAGVLGNVNYLSPEQARGEPVDERGDIYQLGAVLYFAVVGRPPFVRDSARAVMLAHLQTPPPVPSVARPRTPRTIDRLVVKAMLKDPSLRYRSAAEMRAAVRSARGTASDATRVLPLPAGSPSADDPHSPSGTAAAHAGAAAETAVLPSVRMRRRVAASGSPAGAGGSRPAVSGRPGPGHPRGPNSVASGRPPRAVPAPPRARAGLWTVAALAVAVVVVAWALASGSITPSTFAADAATAPPSPDTAVSTPAATAQPSPGAAPPAPTVVIPAITASTLAAARDALTALGLTPGTVTAENSALAADTVLAVDPVVGSTVPVGGTVDLVVASGSNLVPTVAGAPQGDALSIVRAAGFETLVSTRADDSTPGTVLATVPEAGAAARLGTTVSAIVAVPRAAGPDPASTPTHTETSGPPPTSTPGPSHTAPPPPANEG
jgi:serine/threonine-protein kinase